VRVGGKYLGESASPGHDRLVERVDDQQVAIVTAPAIDQRSQRLEQQPLKERRRFLFYHDAPIGVVELQFA
jgi:hypothetical protein